MLNCWVTSNSFIQLLSWHLFIFIYWKYLRCWGLWTIVRKTINTFGIIFRYIKVRKVISSFTISFICMHGSHISCSNFLIPRKCFFVWIWRGRIILLLFFSKSGRKLCGSWINNYLSHFSAIKAFINHWIFNKQLWRCI